MDEVLTDQDLAAIESLKQRGFAVIVWTPSELRDACPVRVEERSIELGWDIIDILCGEGSE